MALPIRMKRYHGSRQHLHCESISSCESDMSCMVQPESSVNLVFCIGYLDTYLESFVSEGIALAAPTRVP